MKNWRSFFNPESKIFSISLEVVINHLSTHYAILNRPIIVNTLIFIDDKNRHVCPFVILVRKVRSKISRSRPFYWHAQQVSILLLPSTKIDSLLQIKTAVCIEGGPKRTKNRLCACIWVSVWEREREWCNVERKGGPILPTELLKFKKHSTQKNFQSVYLIHFIFPFYSDIYVKNLEKNKE